MASRIPEEIPENLGTPDEESAWADQRQWEEDNFQMSDEEFAAAALRPEEMTQPKENQALPPQAPESPAASPESAAANTPPPAETPSTSPVIDSVIDEILEAYPGLSREKAEEMLKAFG